MNNKKKLITAGVLLCALVIAALAVWLCNKPDTTVGSKTIYVAVEAGNHNAAYECDTNAEYLRQALEEQNLIQGTESTYGLFVTTVDGITADESQQQWWCFTRDGVTLETGVDSTPIADGEHYEITLTTGW